MLNIGFLAHPHTGHLKPMVALASELQKRGHGTTFFQIPDVEDTIQQSQMDVYPIANRTLPKGTLSKWNSHLSTLSGLAALRFTCDTIVCQQSAACFAELPTVLRQAAVNGLVIDHMAFYGNLIAEYLQIPFVRVITTIPVYEDHELPPCFTFWSYRPDRLGRLRNRLGNLLPQLCTRRCQRLFKQQRRLWGLSGQGNMFGKPLAQITQLPRCLEFPRAHVPPSFHYVGPLRTSGVGPMQSPRLPKRKRPLIYASLGTLFNGKQTLFRTIAEACAELDADLVISLGGGPLNHLTREALPGNPLILPYAPQTELLAEAALVITHAGLNTVLEALWHGLPMVAIPIADDQPGVATRLAWAGVAAVVRESKLSPVTLNQAVHHVLSDRRFTYCAERLQSKIQQLNSTAYAADIVERALGTARTHVVA
jgi:zeaxanthin glucosyltransferase